MPVDSPAHPFDEDMDHLRRQHKQQQRLRSNPFTKGNGRNNFPGLDFLPGGNDDNGQGGEIELSLCMEETSSEFLNMSIGARAAMTEHLRHIGKYGLDGEQGDFAPALESSFGLAQTHDFDEPRGTPQNTTLDREWDRLLDTTTANLDNSLAPSLVSAISPHKRRCLSAYANTDSIEVHTDVSNDYFDSSKVWALTTPERNRNRAEHILVRGQESFFDPDESSFNDHDDNGATSPSLMPPEMMAAIAAQTYEPQMALSTESTASFPSFTAVDLSVIRGEHDSSFARQNSFGNVASVASFPSINEAGMATPDESLIWSPSRPLFTNSNANTPRSCSSIRPRRTLPYSSNSRHPRASKSSPERYSLRRKTLRRHFQQGDYSQPPSPSPIPAISSASPSAGGAGFEVSLSCSSPVGRALHEFQCFSIYDDEHTSPALSTAPQLSPHMFTGRDMSNRPLRKLRAKRRQPEDDNTLSLTPTDRRNFRTVVPQRVYCDKSPSNYPEVYDSFSRYDDDDDDDDAPVAKSLIGSFDAVTHRDSK